MLYAMLNKYLYIYVRVILFLVIGAFLCCLYCCTPQQKLNRLLKKHPELIHIDTVEITQTFTVPVQQHDTILQLDTATFGLFDIIDRLARELDSVSRDSLRSGIKNYITKRPVLKDTFFVQLQRGGWIKVYQIGSVLKHSLYEPKFVLEAKQKVPMPNIVYRDIPWRLAWYWVLIAFVCGIAIGGYLFYKKEKPGS